jgi:hypothetical protein
LAALDADGVGETLVVIEPSGLLQPSELDPAQRPITAALTKAFLEFMVLA